MNSENAAKRDESSLSTAPKSFLYMDCTFQVFVTLIVSSYYKTKKAFYKKR